MTAGGDPPGIIIINVSVDFKTATMKVLLYKFSSAYSFALSEVEFFNDSRSGQQNITPTTVHSKLMTESYVTSMNISSETLIGRFLVIKVLNRLYKYY